MKNIIIKNENMYNNSYIQVTNYGGYFAEFYITYIANGQPYPVDSGIFAVGQTRRLPIEPKTIGVILRIDVAFLSPTKTLYNKYIDTYKPNCFRLYGSIFNPFVIELNCPKN